MPIPPNTPAAQAKRFKPGQDKNRAYRQVVKIQDILFQTIEANGVKASELAGLARAWCDAEERRRVLTGKPLPGSYRPERKSKGSAGPRGFGALGAKAEPAPTPQAEAPNAVPSVDSSTH